MNKRLMAAFLGLSVFFSSMVITRNEVKAAESNKVGLAYKTHVQNVGWQDWVNDGVQAGTSGKALRVEALNIKLINAPAGMKIKYQTHVQNVGWMDYVSDGQLSGTEGKAYRVEAIRIKIENAEGYSVQYQTHVENVGWQDWVSDGELAGTEGRSLRIEALRIKLIKIDTTIAPSKPSGIRGVAVDNTSINLNYKLVPGAVSYNIYRSTKVDGTYQKIGTATSPSYVNSGLTEGTTYYYKVSAVNGAGEGELSDAISVTTLSPSIEYQGHVQNVGWMNWAQDGQLGGTSGKGYRVEALRIKLKNAPKEMKVRYQAHVQNIGWQDFAENGQLIGTEGKTYRIEAIRILLENAPGYSVQYQTHVQNIGWLDWVNDGQIAGTEGLSLRIEALRIRIVKSGNTMWNVENLGQVAESNGWLYYTAMTNDGALSKIRPDGTGRTKIVDDNANNINVVDNWIYYSNANDNNYIYKIGVNGSNRTRLNTIPSNYVRVVGDSIYFLNEDEGHAFYEMNINGGKVVKINDDPSEYLLLIDEDIYLKNPVSNSALYRYNIDFTKAYKITDDVFDYINVSDKWVYYTNKNDGNKLYKVKNDGTNVTKLADVKAAYISIIGDWVYFYNLSDNGNLYRVKKDGSSMSIFGEETQIKDIDNINISIAKGDKYTLPTVMTVTTIANTKLNVSVTWKPSVVDTSNIGNYTFKGTIKGHEKSVIINLEVGQQGNTLGNISNGGFFAESNGSIYFSFMSYLGLYKINKNDNNKTKIFDGYAENINVVGDNIYFTDNESHLNKMKIDGTGLTKVSDDKFKYVNVIGDTVYYQSNNSSLNKIKTDGSGKTEIIQEQARYINVKDGWIYYVDNSNGNHLYKIRIDGNEKTILARNIDNRPILVDNEWVYFNNGKISKVKVDGTGQQMVYGSDSQNLNIKDGWIIFTPRNVETLYKLKIDTIDGLKKLSNNAKVRSTISVIDEYIYYNSYENFKDVMRRVKIDGTEDKIFHIPEAQ
jgi:uncharacterized protein YjdB